MSGGVNLAECCWSPRPNASSSYSGWATPILRQSSRPARSSGCARRFGGTVVDNKAIRGAAVNPGDVLYTLGTLEDVWITGDIYEDDLARIQVGQPLDAVTTAYPGRSFHGTIARVSPDIDPNTHTLQIRCEVHNPGLKLKPQMLARVRIVTRPGQALVVPQEALVFETNGYYVFVDAGDNRIERRAVAIASWDEKGYARVISGLKAGDHVVPENRSRSTRCGTKPTARVPEKRGWRGQGTDRAMIRSLMGLALRERIVVVGIAIVLAACGYLFVHPDRYRSLPRSGSADGRGADSAQRAQRRGGRKADHRPARVWARRDRAI